MRSAGNTESGMGKDRRPSNPEIPVKSIRMGVCATWYDQALERIPDSHIISPRHRYQAILSGSDRVYSLMNSKGYSKAQVIKEMPGWMESYLRGAVYRQKQYLDYKAKKQNPKGT